MAENSKASDSSARLWPPIARFIGIERKLGERAVAAGPKVAALYEFLRFGAKQAWACLFGGAMVALLVTSHLFYPTHAILSRYDFLVIAALMTKPLCS